MGSGATWVVTFWMSEPHATQWEPSTGPVDFTDDDVALLHRRLRDDAPRNSPRRDWPRLLISASRDDGVVSGTFVTWTEKSTKPSREKECPELRRLMAVLSPHRQPNKFDCGLIHRSPRPKRMKA
jgi:hypothetical protein